MDLDQKELCSNLAPLYTTYVTLWVVLHQNFYLPVCLECNDDDDEYQSSKEFWEQIRYRGDFTQHAMGTQYKILFWFPLLKK